MIRVEPAICVSIATILLAFSSMLPPTMAQSTSAQAAGCPPDLRNRILANRPAANDSASTLQIRLDKLGSLASDLYVKGSPPICAALVQTLIGQSYQFAGNSEEAKRRFAWAEEIATLQAKGPLSPAGPAQPNAQSRSTKTTVASTQTGNCQSRPLGTEMAHNPQVPGEMRGNWVYFMTDKEFAHVSEFSQGYINLQGARTLVTGPIVASDSNGCQVASAMAAMRVCNALGASCVSLGGCGMEQNTAVAEPKDRSWAFVGCGATVDAAMQAAIATCETKSGCPCGPVTYLSSDGDRIERSFGIGGRNLDVRLGCAEAKRWVGQHSPGTIESDVFSGMQPKN